MSADQFALRALQRVALLAALAKFRGGLLAAPLLEQLVVRANGQGARTLVGADALGALRASLAFFFPIKAGGYSAHLAILPLARGARQVAGRTACLERVEGDVKVGGAVAALPVRRCGGRSDQRSSLGLGLGEFGPGDVGGVDIQGGSWGQLLAGLGLGDLFQPPLIAGGSRLGFQGGEKLLGGLALECRGVGHGLGDLHFVAHDLLLLGATALLGPLRLGIVGVFNRPRRGLVSGHRRGGRGRRRGRLSRRLLVGHRGRGGGADRGGFKLLGKNAAQQLDLAGTGPGGRRVLVDPTQQANDVLARLAQLGLQHGGLGAVVQLVFHVTLPPHRPERGTVHRGHLLGQLLQGQTEGFPHAF